MNILSRSTGPIDQSGPGSNGNERVLNTAQIHKAGASLLYAVYCHSLPIFFFFRGMWGGNTPLQEIQLSLYSNLRQLTDTKTHSESKFWYFYKITQKWISPFLLYPYIMDSSSRINTHQRSVSGPNQTHVGRLELCNGLQAWLVNLQEWVRVSLGATFILPWATSKQKA